MGLCASTPDDVSSPTTRNVEVKMKENGEKIAKVALKQKKKMKGLQILGANLDPDYEVKTYPKKDAEFKKIENALMSCANSFIYKELDKAELAKIILAFEPYTAQAGDKIIEQGTEGDYAYVIDSGQAHVIVNGTDVDYCYPNNPSGDRVFGDIALMFNKKRNASIEAMTKCKLYRLARNDFQFTITQNMQKGNQKIENALRKSELLTDLSPTQMDKLIDVTETMPFDKGQVIIKKGAKGDMFFILSSGTVEFSEYNDKGETNSITPDSKQNYFGEKALLSDAPRAATCTAMTNVECLVLNRKDFQETLGDLKTIMEYNLKSRILNSNELFKNLGRKQRKKIKDVFKSKLFEKGQNICTKGDSANEIFIIGDGKVDIIVDGKAINTLSQGEFVGESAIKSKDEQGIRNATVTATSETVLTYYVSSKDWFNVIGSSLDSIIKKEQEIRAAANSKASKFKNLKLSDLQEIAMLGSGTFGRVTLVCIRGSKEETFALKAMQKAQIVEFRQQKNVQNERDLMVEADHPFILCLVTTFQSDRQVFMLLEVCLGGELFTLLHCQGRGNVGLPVSDTQFYGSCVLDGLSFLHEKSICYRDLKPENLLIDSDGYIKIVDFGFAKKIHGKSFTLCGTPEYLAPELVSNKGHNKGVDYWALGVLIFEMLFLFSPFCVDNDPNDHVKILRNIVAGRFRIPGRGDKSENSKIGKVIRSLLTKKVGERAGCMKDGATQLKLDMENLIPKKEFQFNDLVQLKYQAPWKPKLKSKSDHSNFDPYDEGDNARPYVGTQYEDKSGWDKDF